MVFKISENCGITDAMKRYMYDEKYAYGRTH